MQLKKKKKKYKFFLCILFAGKLCKYRELCAAFNWIRCNFLLHFVSHMPRRVCIFGTKRCMCTVWFQYLDSRCDSVLSGALAVLWRGADVRLSQSWQGRSIISHSIYASKYVCGSAQKSKRQGEHLQDCVGGGCGGGGRPLHPALCSLAGRANNLRLTQEHQKHPPASSSPPGESPGK